MLPASSWFRPNPDPLLYMLLELLHIHAENYRQTSNISRTSVGNKIVHHSDVVGESPIGAAPTTSSFSTSRQTTSEQTIQFWDLVWLILDVWWYWAAFMTSEIKKMYLHFLSCLNTELAQIFEIPLILHIQHHGCWWPGDARSPEFPGFSNRRVD